VPAQDALGSLVDEGREAVGIKAVYTLTGGIQD